MGSVQSRDWAGTADTDTAGRRSMLRCSGSVWDIKHRELWREERIRRKDEAVCLPASISDAEGVARFSSATLCEMKDPHRAARSSQFHVAQASTFIPHTQGITAIPAAVRSTENDEYRDMEIRPKGNSLTMQGRRLWNGEGESHLVGFAFDGSGCPADKSNPEFGLWVA